MLILYLTYIDEETEKRKFEDIYYGYRKQMTRVAKDILHNQTDAEDIVQDVFLNIAIRHMDTINKIQNETDLRNYLLKATKNVALNWMNKHSRISYKENETLEIETQILSDAAFLDYICKKMEYERVVHAIQNLGTRYRDVLYYHLILEIPVPKVASMLNQSVPTTKKQLVRGKKKLLKLLEQGQEA